LRPGAAAQTVSLNDMFSQPEPESKKQKTLPVIIKKLEVELPPGSPNRL
jgi:hypothetical protein